MQESKLFPVNPYIALSYSTPGTAGPELLRKIDAAMPAEEIGDRARQVGSYVDTITVGLIPQFYLGGRQILIDMGMLKPTDAIDDVVVRARLRPPAEPVLPPLPRATSCRATRDHRAQIHTERQTQVFEADAIGVTPGDRLHTAFGQLHGHRRRRTASSATASAG